MCGVAGLALCDSSLERLQRAMRAMNDPIHHRGPDDEGTICGDGMAIGMRRLSIIDVAGGHQPISNEANDIHVVCNGEIYNHHELRERLKSAGHRFTTQSDAEVIVHLYEDAGDEFVKELRGMFGLAILDQRRKRIVIARDRLGQKPMFFADHRGSFYFGSEIKSLIAADPDLAKPDYRLLAQYLQFGYFTEPRSSFQHISRLPAGHYATWEHGQLNIQPYWSISFQPDENVNEQDAQKELDHLLKDAVRVRLESEVPLGVFLSGGLDSSAVVAYCHEAGLDPLKTFTVAFDRPEWDESADAQRIAAHFRTDHHELRLSEHELSSTFAETVDAIARHCDEPFGDASAIPTYHISRLARQHVTVILSGDGGDELFAGYSSYRGALFAQQYRKRLPYWLGRYALPATASALSRLPIGSVRYKLQRVQRVLRDSALPYIEAYRDKTSIWQREQIRQLLPEDIFAAAEYTDSQYLPDRLWARMLSDDDLVAKLTEIDLKSYMLDDILIKVDRMSMAHSLEVRSPLLDHPVVEFASRLPTSLKIRNGRGKYLLRELLRNKLPTQSLQKGKQGFSVPLRDWFRGKLLDYVQGVLGPGGSLPEDLFRRSVVDRILLEHRKGHEDHANRIWLLLSFAAWHRQYQCGTSSVAHEPSVSESASCAS